MLERPASKVLFIDGNVGCPLRLQNVGDVDKWIAPAAEFHGGSVNAIFGDLHVEPLDPKRLKANWNEMTKAEK
jgi:prepilin-type processing-associated H-X9-DG protein